MAKPTAWIQLHLSTCLVLMLVGGLLVLVLVIRPSHDRLRYSVGHPLDDNHTEVQWYIARVYAYGYVVPFMDEGGVVAAIVVPGKDKMPTLNDDLKERYFDPRLRAFLLGRPPMDGEIVWTGVLINAILAFTVLVLVAALWEGILRLMKTRGTRGTAQPPDSPHSTNLES